MYILALHNLLHHYLNEFYEEYNIENMSEEDIHRSVAYFTHSTKDFIDSLNTLANIVEDKALLEKLDDQVSMQNHTNFMTLCNAALSELIYDYIIENY